MAAAPFRSPTSNSIASLSLSSGITVDGFTLSLEALKSGQLWAYVVSASNAPLVTVATVKSGQMWAYGALSCRKLGEVIQTSNTVSFTGCSLRTPQRFRTHFYMNIMSLNIHIYILVIYVYVYTIYFEYSRYKRSRSRLERQSRGFRVQGALRIT